MSIHELEQEMNNLSMSEINDRDEEPDLNQNIKKIIKNANIVKNFFIFDKSKNIIEKFIKANKYVLDIYTKTYLFDINNFENFPIDFIMEIVNFRNGIIFFTQNFNENNYDYNIDFIINFHDNLLRFIEYNLYETGYLL